MKTKLMMASLLAAPAMLFVAAPAYAQVAGIATASPTRAIGSTKAYAAANTQIETQFKASFDQIQTRQTALQREIDPWLKQLDTNKDNQLSDAEIDAAQKANSPALTSIRNAQEKAQREVMALSTPAVRAQAFAIENILRQYDAAQRSVVTARKISVILTPDSFVYAPDAVDVTGAITAELDKTVPTVAITPPANWQPSRAALGLQQQLAQIAQAQAEQAAAQQQQQAARPAGTPAAPTQQPPGR